MTIVFESILTESTAQLSYLIGDDTSGTAAVIDPRPDCEIYLAIARRKQVAITHVFDTHNHADFMSGARELAHRSGAKVFMSAQEPPEYGFDHERVNDGGQFSFGEIVLTARHTPGHTPEHMAFLISETDRPDEPWGIFSGDSLLVGSSGRPDLMGQEQSEKLAERLYRTLYEFYLGLNDGVIVYPGHGAGSACGADIGDRPMTTIGYERRTNESLQQESLEAFKRFIEEGAPPEPAHYSRLKKVNARGAPILGRMPIPPGLPPVLFQNAIDESHTTLLDTRDMLAFGGGHIPGAVNIGDRPELSNWAGDMLDPERQLLLVLYDERQLPEIVARLVRVGLINLRGYLVGGMKAWNNQGLPLNRIDQMTVNELQEHRDDLQILDVRSPSEWEQGHVRGAVHQYVGEMRDGVNGLDHFSKEAATAVYCASGYRASIASSLLQRAGYRRVHNVPGSWQAWQAQDLPVEKDSE